MMTTTTIVEFCLLYLISFDFICSSHASNWYFLSFNGNTATTKFLKLPPSHTVTWRLVHVIQRDYYYSLLTQRDYYCSLLIVYWNQNNSKITIWNDNTSLCGIIVLNLIDVSGIILKTPVQPSFVNIRNDNTSLCGITIYGMITLPYVK